MFSEYETARVTVVAVGPSILTGADEVATVVSEVRWLLRRGGRVVVTASALWGERARLAGLLDRVAQEAADALAEPASASVSPASALVLNSGARAAAGLIGVALTSAGIESAVLDARDLSLTSNGDVTDATPVSVDAQRVLRELSRGRVVVVPGGEALGEDGKWATLGVGGRVEGSERATSADVTAVFIAAALGADVRCVRDVDGVYESDPLRRSGGRPRRFRSITWELLESVAPGIVSVRAGEIARAKGVRVRVASPGSEDGTELGVATGFDSPVLPREAATARAMFAAVA